MKLKVYIETSIVSYLTSQLSRDLIIVARQEITRETWSKLLIHFDTFISALVLQEAGRGDSVAASRRLQALESVPILDINDDVKHFAKKLIQIKSIPEKNLGDALHIAVSVMNRMDYLLTWNFAHINNAFTRHRIRKIVEDDGYDCPEFCSPDELFGEEL